MDSYNIHFEKMSNFDLHPLSQHSSSKSSSSIDQYTHHHGKGDSAYSSFSGGSTAPDYPSPFSADDLHQQNLHYADLRYVKAMYGPSILHSHTKSVSEDQHHHSHDGCSHVKDPPVPITHLPPPPPLPPPPLTPPPPPSCPPPPPPLDYLDSFITAKKHEPSVMSLEGQFSNVSSFRHQTSNSEILGSKPDLVYDNWVPQNYERKQNLVEKTPDLKLESRFVRSPLQTWQPEHLQQNMEKQSDHSRSHSESGVSVGEKQHTVNSWHVAQNTVTGSIQHKGQFYFVTGVYKSCESGVPPAPQYPIDIIETHTSAEIQRSHNTVEDMFKHVPLRKQGSGEIFFQEKQCITPNGHEEPSGSHHFSKPQNVGDLEHMSMDVGRCHTQNHPIFYCGPEDNFSTSSQHKPVTSAFSVLDQNIHLKQEEPVNKLTRQAIADVPTEKISKETTPLLYHLTGASRANVKKSVKKDRNSTVGCKESDWSKDHQEAGRESGGHSEHNSEVAKEEKSKEFYYLCNTMDDSFKKYYKEKLKDAQTKVLRETSFKRKDLRLSWQKMIEHFCDKKLSDVPSGTPSQENPNPAHLLTLQNADSLNNTNHEMKKETVKQQNIAQPQVPRVGCRKRLTIGQKKLSNSEPEKLHHLGEGPTHVTCRSLGSEREGLLSEEYLVQHGLVAVRRKMFEVRGRAMSACSISKSSLKHLQQKALVAYMERKTGCKVAEPQQASPQVLTAGRHSDWASKPYTGSMEKPLRPQSASRVLDSGSIVHTLSTSVHHGDHLQQSSWRERPSPPSGKSASMDDLLEAREQPRSCRSSSSPHSSYQIQKRVDSFTHDKRISGAEIRTEGERPVCKEYTASVVEQKRVRMVASRGKSMEELGRSVVSRPKVLSKSTDHLNQVQMSVREKGNSSKQHYSSDDLQVRPESRTSKEPGSLEHTPTSTAGSSCVRTSPLSFKEGNVTASSSSPRGTSENNLMDSKSKAVPEETFLMKGEMLHEDENDVHSVDEVFLSYGITTDASLWLLSPETCDEKTHEEEASHHSVPHHLHIQPAEYGKRGSVSGCVQLAATSAPAPAPPPPPTLDGAREWKKKVESKCSVDQARWETLVQEVVTADQSLACILYPVANRKTAIMLMEQMLSEDNLLMEDHYKKKQEQKVTSLEQNTFRTSAAADDDDDDDDEVSGSSTPHDCTIPLTAQHPALYSTGANVTEKKRQLMAHIEEQLKSLEGLRSTLRGEEMEVGLLGNSLEALVQERCSPAELERFTQFIEDLERVISLLLCLSARLARVENALSTVDENMDSEEKESLLSRHQLLCKQREDAKDLKDNLERREHMVSTFLAKHLTEVQLQKYRRFIQYKASLLIHQKALEEKQRLWEEQLQALLNSIPP
ncbi:hypothetical protein Q7C36_017843 [Tachysurus vachellii]|uniref:Uncharacterized protein n=1 Tax=Tachysurus vachellii TaxID=175792 RepID=A0AA88S4M4_TACVA|nr:hypothetical protein Q7C36_017843 [Tachysurus vachellii]